MKTKFTLFWRTIDKKTLGIWSLCFLGINTVTIVFAVLYSNALNITTEETVKKDEGESKIDTIDVDTIGEDPFVETGFISNNNQHRESYYAITSEGYLYTWGWNLNGELGLGVKDTYIPSPTYVNLDGSFYDENENGIKDNNEFYTITEGDKVKKVEHINSSSSVNNASTFVISQDDYLYMWGSTIVLPNNDKAEYIYSGSKSSQNMNYYMSPTFVNLDDSYEKADDGSIVLEPARDIDGFVYKDNSNNNISVQVPTKTEGDKVSDVDIYAHSNSGYGGIVLSKTGELYGWGKNLSGTLRHDSPDTSYFNNLELIDYGTSDTYGDVKYVEASIHNKDNNTTITALTEDGRLFIWGYSSLIPTVNVTANTTSSRIEIDLSDPSMSLDPSGNTEIVDYTYSSFHKSFQVITADGFLYTLGSGDSRGSAGRGCESSGQPENEKFYRVDLGCDSDSSNDKIKTAGNTDMQSYLISEDDYMYTYGWNNGGQSGQGSNNTVTYPTRVDINQNSSTNDQEDKVVYANIDNADQAAVINESGDLYMWGWNTSLYGIMPDTSNNAFNYAGDNIISPVKVNLKDHENGEKYTSVALWNIGGIAATDYLNIYTWGGYDDKEPSESNASLRNVDKVTKENFVTPAIALK